MEMRKNLSEFYNSFTLQQIQDKYPYLEWKEYVADLVPSNTTIDVVSIDALPFFDKFGELIGKTTNRTIANYLLWRLTKYSADYLTDEVRKRQLNYGTVEMGREEFSVRWVECISIVNSKLPTAVSAMYVRNYFPPEAKEAALAMVDQIRKEFNKTFEQIDWMDSETKSAAHKKLGAITNHIGYPDELYDDRKLDDYYKAVEVDSRNYLKSILNIDKFDFLRPKGNKTDWITHTSVADVNAYYWPDENSIRMYLNSKLF